MNGPFARVCAMLAIVTVAILSAVSAGYAQGYEGFRVGLYGGVNFNYVDAATQRFVDVPGNPGFSTHDFSGSSDFVAMGGIVGEYIVNDLFGLALRAGYDSRCVTQEVDGSRFTPHLTYITLEPALRINIGMPEFHFLGGGTIGVNVLNEYDYSPKIGEGASEVIDADLMHASDFVFGAWGGFGYDLRITGAILPFDFVVTPFIEGSYLFDQKEPDVATSEDLKWETFTARGGLQLKLEF